MVVALTIEVEMRLKSKWRELRGQAAPPRGAYAAIASPTTAWRRPRIEQREARFRRLSAAQVFAGQHPAGERAVGKERHRLAKQRLGEIVVHAA
jgi:hypothetical protein